MTSHSEPDSKLHWPIFHPMHFQCPLSQPIIPKKYPSINIWLQLIVHIAHIQA